MFLKVSNNVVDMDMKLHTHLWFDGLTCTQWLKQCNIHVNNPHNKLHRKVFLDITICTFYVNVNNSILHCSGEIHLHITGECLFVGITIQLCPSTRGQTTITIVYLVTVHAACSKKSQETRKLKIL